MQNESIKSFFEDISKEKGESFDLAKEVVKARQELATEHITSERKEAFGPLSERLERTVYPRTYNKWRVDYLRLLFNSERKRYEITGEQKKMMDEDVIWNRFFKYTEMHANARDDAWRFYLGIPQQYETFGVSDFQPTKSRDEKYYYSIPQIEDEVLRMFLDKNIPIPRNMSVGQSCVADEGAVMGNFTLSYDEDKQGHYLSYYDIWDVEPFGKKYELSKILNSGKPFEIYNRIYFNPKKIK